MSEHDWLDALRGRFVRAEVGDDGDVAVYSLRSSLTVDLESVPDGERLVLSVGELRRNSEIKVTGARSVHGVVVCQPVSVEVDGDLGELTVELTGTESGAATLTGQVGRLCVTGGELKLAEAAATEAAVVDGQLSGNADQLDRVEVRGQVALPQSLRRLVVGASGAEVTLSSAAGVHKTVGISGRR